MYRRQSSWIVEVNIFIWFYPVEVHRLEFRAFSERNIGQDLVVQLQKVVSLISAKIVIFLLLICQFGTKSQVPERPNHSKSNLIFNVVAKQCKSLYWHRPTARTVTMVNFYSIYGLIFYRNISWYKKI